MSRKQFEAIASALRGNRPFEDEAPAVKETWRCIVRAMADVCAASNGRFDRDRFYRAAGYER